MFINNQYFPKVSFFFYDDFEQVAPSHKIDIHV